MANYYGAARTNYFRVKDETAFRTWVAEVGLELWEGKPDRVDVDGLFALGPNPLSDNGTLDLPWDEEKDEQREIMDELAPHLADNSICVLMESGHEKLRYITGNAVAFNNKGEYVQVNLNDIYDLAKAKFGLHSSITSCEY